MSEKYKIEQEMREYLLKISPPKDKLERILLKKMKKELGTITTVKEVAAFLKTSKTIIYDAIAAGEILVITKGRRKLIITEGLLPFLR